jgi:hypothetical protein
MVKERNHMREKKVVMMTRMMIVRMGMAIEIEEVFEVVAGCADTKGIIWGY